MIPNKGFNGAHKRNLGGRGREKTPKSTRGVIRHNGVNVAARRRTIYVERHKGRWWELLSQTAGERLRRCSAQTGRRGSVTGRRGSVRINGMFN